MFLAVAARGLLDDAVGSGAGAGWVLDEEGSDSRDGARALVAGTPHNSLTAGNRGLLSPRAKRWLEVVGGGYVVVRCTGGESGCGGRSVGEAAGAGEAGAPLEEDEAVAGNGGEPAAVLAGDDLLELVWLSLERRWVWV
jgi:hypothetical protein